MIFQHLSLTLKVRLSEYSGNLLKDELLSIFPKRKDVISPSDRLTEKREIPFVCNNEGHTTNKEENIFHEFFYEHNRFSPSNALCSRRCSEHLQVEG